MTSAISTPVCVIGAGIIGLSAALHLVREGAREIIVVDAEPPLGGTTPAGAGFVARFAADSNRREHPAAIAIEEHSLAFYRGLHEAGHDIEYAANGNIVLAVTEETLEKGRHGIVGHPRALPDTRMVNPREIAELSSGAIDADAVLGGVFMPEAIQLTTALAARAVTAELEAAGVEFRFETTVTGFQTSNGAVTGVETSSGLIPAATVVIAAGAWSNTLLRMLDWAVPALPVVATRFVTPDVGLAPTMPTVQCLDFALWLRELHGGFSWGSAVGYRSVELLERSGESIGYGRPSVDSLIETQRAFQPQLERVFPALGGVEPTTIIQGMPFYTADGSLYAGPVPSTRGVWMVGGDNEAGVTRGPGMGRLIAQLIAGVAPFTDPTPFALDRHDPALYPDSAAIAAAMQDDRVFASLV